MAVNEKELSLSLFRLRAARECENIAGRFAYFFSASQTVRIAAMFAGREDTRIEMPWGVYNGKDAAERCFLNDMTDRDSDDSARIDADVRGRLVMNDTTSGIVEVAGDGDTAKGLWMFPGVEGYALEGGPQAFWNWSALRIDFVFEDGQWKIRNLTYRPYYNAPYTGDWGDGKVYIHAPSRCTADAPVPAHYTYSADAVYPDDELGIPVPYDTWTE